MLIEGRGLMMYLRAGNYSDFQIPINDELILNLKFTHFVDQREMENINA